MYMQVLSAKLSPIRSRLIETKLTIFVMAFAIGLICRKKSIAIALPFRKDHLTKNTRTNMSDSVCNCTRAVHKYRRHPDGVTLVHHSKILCTTGL